MTSHGWVLEGNAWINADKTALITLSNKLSTLKYIDLIIQKIEHFPKARVESITGTEIAVLSAYNYAFISIDEPSNLTFDVYEYFVYSADFYEIEDSLAILVYGSDYQNDIEIYKKQYTDAGYTEDSQGLLVHVDSAYSIKLLEDIEYIAIIIIKK